MYKSVFFKSYFKTMRETSINVILISIIKIDRIIKANIIIIIIKGYSFFNIIKLCTISK